MDIAQAARQYPEPGGEAGTQRAEYLENLIRLAGEKSPEKRRELLEEISELFFSSSGDVSDHESELMGDILYRLVRAVEMTVRRNLAERLAGLDDAPHELVTALANDDIEVAAPILTRSGVLKDDDLIEIVKHRTQEHVLTVARRRSLSEEVSDALVDSGSDDVIETLLDNHSALISRRAMSYLTEQSKRVDRFQQPLLTRPELPPELAYDMFDWVSGALRQHILSSYDINEAVINDALEVSKQEALGEEGAEGPQPSEAEKLVQRLESAGLLTENFLVQTLRDGRIDVFTIGLAAKSNIKLKTARRIFFDRGDEGLAILCRANGFDRSTFASLLLLKRKSDGDGTPMAPTVLERTLGLYDTITQRNAWRVLRFWNIRQHDVSSQPDGREAGSLSQTA